MAYPKGIFQSFAQGLMLPGQFMSGVQQYKRGKVSQEQAKENLLKSQILNKYIERDKMAQLQKQADSSVAARDKHLSELQTQKMAPDLAREKHMLALSLINKRMQPSAPLVNIGYDQSGRPQPTNISGQPSSRRAIPSGPPGVLQQYLQEQGVGRPSASPRIPLAAPQALAAPGLPGGLPSVQQETALGRPQDLPADLTAEAMRRSAPGEPPSVTGRTQSLPEQEIGEGALNADEQYFANLMTGTKRGAIGKQFRTNSGITFTPLVPSRIDKLQGANQAINQMLPILEEIKKEARTHLYGGIAFSATARARLNAVVDSGIETNIAGFGLGGTDFGRKLSRSQLAPILGEPEGAFLKRIDDFAKAYERRRIINNKLLRTGGTITYPPGKDPRKKKSKAPGKKLLPNLSDADIKRLLARGS